MVKVLVIVMCNQLFHLMKVLVLIFFALEFITSMSHPLVCFKYLSWEPNSFYEAFDVHAFPCTSNVTPPFIILTLILFLLTLISPLLFILTFVLFLPTLMSSPLVHPNLCPFPSSFDIIPPFLILTFVLFFAKPQAPLVIYFNTYCPLVL